MGEAATVLTEVQGAVGTITFNRPERRNALSPDMLIRLHEILTGWMVGGEIRAVVITGSGDKAFSSGYDILSIPTNLTPETEQLLRDSNALEVGLRSVKQFPYPVIAMLNGHCFGGALNLALCCDLRIGADDIAIGMPPAKLGVVYPAEGVAQLVQVAGMAHAREILFTGRTYRGPEALAMQLVDRLVSRGELRAATYALAQEIAGNAPLALKGLKRILNLIEAAAPLSVEALREAESLVAAALASDDVKEGQMAFLEKRAPRFVGR